jgi:hypothetical protein
MHPYMMAPALTGFHRNKPSLCGTVVMVAPYGSTGDDCNLSVGVWVVTAGAHHSLIDLEFFIPDDLDLARRRLAEGRIADPVLSCFPCWGVFSRAGNRQTWGHFTVVSGRLLQCIIPGASEDAEHRALDERVELLELGGPCFYGFEIVSRERVQAHVEARRVKRVQPVDVEGDATPPSITIDWSAPCPDCADRVAAGLAQPHTFANCPELPF